MLQRHEAQTGINATPNFKAGQQDVAVLVLHLATTDHQLVLLGHSGGMSTQYHEIRN